MTTEQLLQLRETFREGRVHFSVKPSLSSPEVEAWLKEASAMVFASVEDEVARRMN